LSHAFPIEKWLKQGDDLLPLLFTFILECSIREVPKNQVRLKLNGTHQLLVNANDFNLLGEIINTSNKNTEAAIDASIEVGLKVNADKN
jgi:hypothetical protein